MNDIDIALAQWAGWTLHESGHWISPDKMLARNEAHLPSYSTSLDACATLVEKLTDEQATEVSYQIPGHTDAKCSVESSIPPNSPPRFTRWLRKTDMKFTITFKTPDAVFYATEDMKNQRLNEWRRYS